MTAPITSHDYDHSPLADAKPLSADTRLADRGTPAAANDGIARAIPDDVINPLWLVTAGLVALFAFFAVGVATV